MGGGWGGLSGIVTSNGRATGSTLSFKVDFPKFLSRLGLSQLVAIDEPKYGHHHDDCAIAKIAI